VGIFLRIIQFLLALYFVAILPFELHFLHFRAKIAQYMVIHWLDRHFHSWCIRAWAEKLLCPRAELCFLSFNQRIVLFWLACLLVISLIDFVVDNRNNLVKVILVSPTLLRTNRVNCRALTIVLEPEVCGVAIRHLRPFDPGAAGSFLVTSDGFLVVLRLFLFF
jgi:hypothetical protein